MMRKIKLLFTIAAFCVASLGAYAQYTPAVYYHPAPPVPGKPLTISYHPEGTPLAGESNIQGVMYYWIDYAWEAADIDMVKTDTAWVATFTVPENTALTFLKFTAGGKVDTGGSETYGMFTMDEEGRNIPGAYIGWAVARGKNTERYHIPGYVQESTRLLEDDVLRFWYNNELRYHAESYPRVIKYADETISRMDPERAQEIMRRDVEFLMSAEGMPEERLLEAHEIASRLLQDQGLAAAVEAQILARFPDGIAARDKEIWRIFRVEDPEQKIAEFAAFLDRFPTAEFVDVRTETSDMWYAKVFQSVVYTPITSRDDYSLLCKYIGDQPYESLATFMWHIVQIPYSNGHATAEKVRPHADLIVNEMLTRPQRLDHRVYSPREWQDRIYENNRSAFMVYSQILGETGDQARAIEVADRIAPYFGHETAEFNDYYVTILGKSGRGAEIVPFIEQAVNRNAATPEMLAILQKNYTGKDFDAYLTQLKTDKLQAQREKLDKEIVDLPIELFALETLGGGTVDMAAMKGKILVLDFWATWCAPCKAAMPGMNMAVQKYAGDEGVAFFFISTMENGSNYKKGLSDFLAEKGFGHFVVPLDSETTGGRAKDLVYNTYAREFRFSGIPQKMIIDGKGRLRWRSLGYHGSPSELADEISYIIEKLKAE